MNFSRSEVIAISRFDYDRLSRIALFKKLSYHVTNCGNEKYNKNMFCLSNRRKILCVARYCKQKNLERLIKAFKFLPKNMSLPL